MMHDLGNFIVKRRWSVLLAWLVAAIIIVGFSPKLSSIESDNQTSFLPSNYESVRAGKVADHFSAHSQSATDTIVFKNSSGSVLSSSQQQTVSKVVRAVDAQHLAHVSSITTS